LCFLHHLLLTLLLLLLPTVTGSLLELWQPSSTTLLLLLWVRDVGIYKVVPFAASPDKQCLCCKHPLLHPQLCPNLKPFVLQQQSYILPRFGRRYKL
jgi:hypothetical protein